MDSRKLLFDVYTQLLEEIPDADKTDMGGGLDIYHGTHPKMGQVVIACAMGEHAVLITTDQSGNHKRPSTGTLPVPPFQ